MRRSLNWFPDAARKRSNGVPDDKIFRVGRKTSYCSKAFGFNERSLFSQVSFLIFVCFMVRVPASPPRTARIRNETREPAVFQDPNFLT